MLTAAQIYEACSVKCDEASDTVHRSTYRLQTRGNMVSSISPYLDVGRGLLDRRSVRIVVDVHVQINVGGDLGVVL